MVTDDELDVACECEIRQLVRFEALGGLGKCDQMATRGFTGSNTRSFGERRRTDPE
jgi:hypothetical protein